MSIAKLLHYTYDDYKSWEGAWELIDGIPVSMAPAPMKIHQMIASELFFCLKQEVDDGCLDCEVLYEMDWKISNSTTVRPDIVLTCNDNGDRYLIRAPKIIIEILSPSTAQKDETVKFDIYEEESVQYYILVYPDDLKAKVYSLKNDNYSKRGDFTNEKLTFDDIDCDIELDFKKVFEKFELPGSTSPEVEPESK
ncbi:MAG: Uma2 family endonuclease [Campylobacterota bacterium]|nr:Uma2 family endonuclease [Campylobacterota bacterium]